MQVEINSGPAFAFGEIALPAGGSVRVEAGAMAMTHGDVQIATSTQGGFMKGLKRTLGGESFFVNDFSSATGGTVGVAAALPGDMSMVRLDGSTGLLVQSGSWIASDTSVTVDSKWGGGKTFFSGEGLILLKCTGPGRPAAVGVRRHPRAHARAGRGPHPGHGPCRGLRRDRPVQRAQGRQLEVDPPRRRGPGHRLHGSGSRVAADPQQHATSWRGSSRKLPPQRS